jgi:hypothetical protein
MAKARMGIKILAAGFALFAIITPASANVVTVTATGTVSSGADTTGNTYGLFGPVGSDLTGAQFTVVYTFDLNDAAVSGPPRPGHVAEVPVDGQNDNGLNL